MALDQVHKQNSKVIKSTGGATDLVKKRDDSYMIHWETCGSCIAKIITEFEKSEGKPLAKSALSTKHHEDNGIFCKNFDIDIKSLSRGLPINPFMSTEFHETHNDSIVVPDFMFERIKYMEDIGETFKNFVNNWLIFGKKPTSADIHTNKFKIWDFSVTDDDKPFAPTNSIINKMQSASENRPELAEIIFKYEIVDVAQSLASTSDTAYHGKKSDILKRLLPFSLPYLPNKESNATIIIEISLVIHAKCVLVISDIECFSDLAVVIFYHV